MERTSNVIINCRRPGVVQEGEGHSPSEIFVGHHWTTRRCIPQDRTVHKHRYESLKSCMNQNSLNGEPTIVRPVRLTITEDNKNVLSVTSGIQPCGQ
jgi:predicted metal-dependent RNase